MYYHFQLQTPISHAGNPKKSIHHPLDTSETEEDKTILVTWKSLKHWENPGWSYKYEQLPAYSDECEQLTTSADISSTRGNSSQRGKGRCFFPTKKPDPLNRKIGRKEEFLILFWSLVFCVEVSVLCSVLWK